MIFLQIKLLYFDEFVIQKTLIAKQISQMYHISKSNQHASEENSNKLNIVVITVVLVKQISNKGSAK